MSGSLSSNEYKKYVLYLSRHFHEMPFIYKYLTLSCIKRLKGIDYFCGMRYASKDIYQFATNVSRYDHSVATALLTWKYTKDKKATLAALFHDISTPVFSHVIDYMNKDYLTQESTEEKTKEILCSDEMLAQYLKMDGTSVEEIANFKNFSVVDNDRPKLCTDRLDGIITSSMLWANDLEFRYAMKIIDAIYYDKTEKELSFDNGYEASYFVSLNDKINEMMHSNEDTYMMDLLANIVRRLIKKNIVSYNSLYSMEEAAMIDIIENMCNYDEELKKMWIEFKTIKYIDKDMNLKIKERDLNPLVLGRRLI